MKHLFLLLSILCPLSFASAQKVSVGTISKFTMCTGDTLLVPFESSGTFQPDNFFAIQLSDANGSFAKFTNIGHSTISPNTIPVAIGIKGDHFRVRVIATDPYTVSENTSPDIQVVSYPRPQPIPNDYATSFGYVGFTGNAVQFSDNSSESSGTTYSWSFGQDADITTSSSPSPNVTYHSDGVKSGILTVTNSLGCTASASFQTKIISCFPVIPDTVHIVTGTESGKFPYVWVKPGGNYTVEGGSIIGRKTTIVFAEPGSSISTTSQSLGFYYLKKDASFNWDFNSNAVVILKKGNAISYPFDVLHNMDTLSCDNLQFDYSKVGGTSEVQPTENPLQILNSANSLRISNKGADISASVVNLLGVTLLSKTESDQLTLDLSTLTNGVYFVIITSNGQREMRKITVVH